MRVQYIHTLSSLFTDQKEEETLVLPCSCTAYVTAQPSSLLFSLLFFRDIVFTGTLLILGGFEVLKLMNIFELILKMNICLVDAPLDRYYANIRKRVSQGIKK